MSQTNKEKLYEIKKVGKYWLLGRSGMRLKRHHSLTNFKEVELSDDFLIADGDIFEIQEDERGEVTLVEIEDAPAAEKGQNVCNLKQRNKTNDDTMNIFHTDVFQNALNINVSTREDVAKRFTKDSYARAHITHIDTDLEDVYDELEMGQTEDNDNSFENGQTEDNYQSFEGGHTEDTIPIEDTLLSTLTTTRQGTTSRIGRQFPWSTRGLQLFETKAKIVVKVYSADILTAPVDCIVNDANVNLQHDGGIALAIAKAAGKDLAKQCRDYLKNHGKLRVGEACYTGAGKMPYDCVIHAIGPCWSDYHPYSMRDVEKCEVDLYNAVINSLTIAENRKLKMIAISSISSGIYGCPLDLCSVQYARAVLDYSALSHSPLKEIHFVDTNMEMVKTIQETFQAMIPGDKVPKSYNKLKYVRFQWASNESEKGRRTSQHAMTDELHLSMNAHDTSEKWSKSARAASSKSGMVIYPFCYYDFPPGKTKEKAFACCFGEGQNLSIYTGDILSVKNIDIVVCENILSGNTEDKLAKAISEKGGKPYKTDKKAAFKKDVQPGDVVVCKSGYMKNIKWIAHAVPDRKDENDDRMHTMDSVFLKLFDTLKDAQCHSLAIPLIGTGEGKADPVYCAERFIDSLMQFCSFEKSFRFRIHLINQENDKTNTAVEVVKKAVRNSRPLSVRVKHETTSSSYQRQSTSSRPDTVEKAIHSQQKYDPGIRGGLVDSDEEGYDH